MNPRQSEHDELREIMRRFAAMMDAPAPVDHAGLLRERLRFSQVFAAHLVAEQDMLSNLDHDDPALDAKTRQRGDRIAALRADYSTHVRYWTPLLIREEWPAYRRNVLALQQRLHACLAWEEANLPFYG